ncbi:MAG: DEAD/DEAH box helicase [Pirellulaceae bacterium]|nr:DEAD/DEAH box helicase [Pirellulaceae bacterium]
MTSPSVDRDELAALYLEQLPYEPYPVQQDALLSWFTARQGVLVCAPTGTGKTLIAEAALFEALHTGRMAYYTTPLIALTDQKFQEMQDAAVRWGFSADQVGLVTGNRRVNPDAPVLVVVAEILFNRLLHRSSFHFDEVSAVVMDEFHSFNDRERGIVWELTLGLLPEQVRTLLLSATVGNAAEFVQWLARCHQRKLELVQSSERKIPLTYQWVGDQLLSEQLELMAAGDDAARQVPALIFCFNRETCWTVAEQLKGKGLLAPGQQKRLVAELEAHDWSQGAGPKLKQLLLRGVAVHHAGVLPGYRRIVEHLFQQKLLSVAVCTETLSAGINLPARSVVLPGLLKGPPGDKKLIDPSTAHQIFGRAGRPQYDNQGFVFALAHEDDVKILRWRQKYDTIPEDTKDPNLRKAKKALKKKMPTRRSSEQYWTEAQFNQLRVAPPAKLSSRGALPWRLLAHMLDASPDVELVRNLVSKRLMPPKRLEEGQKELNRMLLTLWRAGYVELEPRPPMGPDPLSPILPAGSPPGEPSDAPASWQPMVARPTPLLQKLAFFRGVNPLYGVYLVNQLGMADRHERLQAMESVLEMPGSVARYVRVPNQEELPPGPLATSWLDVKLLQLGLVTPEQLGAGEPPEEPEERRMFGEERVFVLTLAEKLRMLFDYDFPGVHSLQTNPVWAAGEVLEFGGDFNKYVTSKQMQKQEGIVFRHLLRLILLLAEFEQLAPPDYDPGLWRDELRQIGDQLTACCHRVDPTSTDKALEQAAQAAEPKW